MSEEEREREFVCVYVCVCVSVYMYVCMYVYIYNFVYCRCEWEIVHCSPFFRRAPFVLKVTIKTLHCLDLDGLCACECEMA